MIDRNSQVDHNGCTVIDFEDIRRQGVLFDSTLKRMSLIPDLNKNLCVEIEVETQKGNFKVTFLKVSRLEFSHYSGYTFYHFENTKMYSQNDEYYFSFDPSEISEISNDDQDVIVCSSIEFQRIPD